MQCQEKGHVSRVPLPEREQILICAFQIARDCPELA
jgi:hypothetical protein